MLVQTDLSRTSVVGNTNCCLPNAKLLDQEVRPDTRMIHTENKIQANLIITLSLGSIETDSVICEPCYNEITFYRHMEAMA